MIYHVQIIHVPEIHVLNLWKSNLSELPEPIYESWSPKGEMPFVPRVDDFYHSMGLRYQVTEIHLVPEEEHGADNEGDIKALVIVKLA